MKSDRKRKVAWVAAVALIALGGATRTLAEQRLSGEQQNACGSILCLLGGVTSGECAAYLNPFFAIRPPDLGAKRLDFLNKCPTGGSMPNGVVALIANTGNSCQSATLAARLNAEVMQCEAELERERFDAWMDPGRCKPSESLPQRNCGTWYNSSYTLDLPPALTATNCRGFSRTGAGIGCTWRWIAQ